jgi:hypothetical protein
MHDSSRKIDQENLDDLKLLAMLCQERIIGVTADEVVSRMENEEIGHEMQVTMVSRAKQTL